MTPAAPCLESCCRHCTKPFSDGLATLARLGTILDGRSNVMMCRSIHPVGEAQVNHEDGVSNAAP